jgi:hypothetical protein
MSADTEQRNCLRCITFSLPCGEQKRENPPRVRPSEKAAINSVLCSRNNFASMRGTMKKTTILSLWISMILTFISETRLAIADGIVIERNPGPPAVSRVEPFKVRGTTDSSTDLTYFVARSGKVFSVRAQWIVAIIDFPDLEEPQQITTQSDLNSLLSKKSKLQEIAARVSQARPYVTRPIAALDAAIARFRSGHRKIDGKWFTPAQLAAAEAERKAQEEKRAAEQKAEEEKRAAEQKAEEERRVLAEKAAEEKRRAEKARLVAQFKDKLQKVLPDVVRVIGSFHEITNFDQIKQLPNSLSDSIDKLTASADGLRKQTASDLPLDEGRQEIVTTDALQMINEVGRNTAAEDVSASSSQVSAFLQANPDPPSNEQKPLWTYLESIRTLCSQQEKDANVHIQKGQSLFSAGKMSDAIREYQQAYRAFPNPQTATKIKEIQDATLGL